MQFLVVVADVHGSTREHVRRTYEDGIAYLVDKLLDVLERGQCTPCGLVDAQLVEHSRELVAVLGTVDVDRAGTQYGNTLAVQLHGEVVRYLSTHRDNDTTGLLEVHDVEHTLQRQLVEVEAVAHVVVGRHGLGVVVNHDRLVTQLAGSVDGVDRTPVELYRRTDAVGTRAEDDNRLLVLVVVDVVRCGIDLTVGLSECRCVGVGEVQVVGQLGMLAGNGGDALHAGQDALLLTVLANLQVLLLHIGRLGLQYEAGYLEVRETALLNL